MPYASTDRQPAPLQPGLVSVTFRQLPAESVVELAARAQLAAIEWGGDIHVPHGDLDLARHVAAMTADAGLDVACYGSYYRLGHSSAEGLAPETVVETAAALGAPTIRVWAGRIGSDEADPAYWDAVVTDARRVAELAGAAGMTVSFEYHRNTLTDTRESARRLLGELADVPIRTLWQPAPERDRAENLGDLRDVLPWLHHVHVFTWTATRERLPLADGLEDWAAYLDVASDGGARYALLEFVADDSPVQFADDAATLVTAMGAPRPGNR
ncbi:TIM barrel protein [Planotetraspora sp. A-T 1434]|uniref:sugar phosphate isomerase/epimerase family protein n=1 Tax=Planotetraspora sp. A-T 1434 TaxID=2979219 RepID=UPI0021C24AEF|nr:TIM barrel protein [Planotetraspora sp. A-T 1434]MCT9932164.1 TIM barrel protein [Planotetraspora sp. A-T 1434]